MKFIQIFFISAIVTCSIYVVAVLLLIDAPIPAEYWVGEMITIKKKLVKDHSGLRKIIVAGGSSTLFGIDAESASKQLNIPVINFGLHAGLKLERILQEVRKVAERGDLLILSLAPSYYNCHKKPSEWQVKNIIGWDHGAWEKMNYAEKAEFVTLVSPITLGEMFLADIQRKYFPTRIIDRLSALDNSLVLSRFRDRISPTNFEYSAYHLNGYGDMLKAEGVHFKGAGQDISKPNHICSNTSNHLLDFVESMNKKGVLVYFSNTPYIDSNVAKDEIINSEVSFKQEFSAIGCFIDKREDLVFDRKYFFNTSLHLNTEGRSIRTELFINSIRNNVLSGRCD